MAVTCPPDNNTCDHCGEEIIEDDLMVRKFLVFQDGTYLTFCSSCFPKLFPGVQVQGGWKRHFRSVSLLESSSGTST